MKNRTSLRNERMPQKELKQKHLEKKFQNTQQEVLKTETSWEEV